MRIHPSIESHYKEDWLERIAEAREVGEFSNLDALHASNWFSCALGERAKTLGYHNGLELPTNVRGTSWTHDDPVESLSSYGYEFPYAVKTNDFDLAQAICERMDEILNEFAEAGKLHVRTGYDTCTPQPPANVAQPKGG